MDEIDKIKVKIVHILFSNDNSNFKIIKTEKVDGKILIIQGVFPDILVGDFLECEGTYFEHQKYGLQFRVSKYTKTLKKDITKEDKILAFLSSGAIKGIGKGLSEKIVKKFKEKSIDIISTDPESLSTVQRYII